VADAIRPNTRLIWLETPSNPQLKIADIAAIAALGKARGILTACDNTWATPYFQRPLALGVDAVMHSSTKYFGGHSDLLGGCVVLAEKSELSARIRDFQNYGGATPAPFDCWLLLRSLATFPLRMPVHAHNAFEIAKFLEKHPKIERVLYPGLASHPNHAVAARQMSGGFGGMLSVQVRGGQAEALRFAGSMNLFRHATSLGGVESLIEHRLSAEGPHPKSPENLLRVSVGIEHLDDLLADLEMGLGV
jgi:cystathionine gamma-synthase